MSLLHSNSVMASSKVVPLAALSLDENAQNAQDDNTHNPDALTVRLGPLEPEMMDSKADPKQIQTWRKPVFPPRSFDLWEKQSYCSSPNRLSKVFEESESFNSKEAPAVLVQNTETLLVQSTAAIEVMEKREPIASRLLLPVRKLRLMPYLINQQLHAVRAGNRETQSKSGKRPSDIANRISICPVRIFRRLLS